jgi:hypothetical protein
MDRVRFTPSVLACLSRSVGRGIAHFAIPTDFRRMSTELDYAFKRLRSSASVHNDRFNRTSSLTLEILRVRRLESLRRCPPCNKNSEFL